MKSIFYQVGPQLFNDVLKEEIKSYYQLSDAMKKIYMMTPVPEKWKSYEVELNQAVDYYLPFYRKFKTRTGSENSWNHTRKYM